MSRSPEERRKGDLLLSKWQREAAKNVVPDQRVPFGDQQGRPGVPYPVKIPNIADVARRIASRDGCVFCVHSTTFTLRVLFGVPAGFGWL